MYKTRLLSLSIGVLVTYAFLHSVAQAAFPDDFDGVVWRDPAVVATWAETATLSVSHNSSALRIINSKRAVWPRKLHSILAERLLQCLCMGFRTLQRCLECSNL